MGIQPPKVITTKGDARAHDLGDGPLRFLQESSSLVQSLLEVLVGESAQTNQETAPGGALPESQATRSMAKPRPI